MKQNMIIKKLRSRKGESLVEVLVSMLITVLSVSTLAMMIDSSAKLSKKSEETMQEYYEAGNTINRQETDAKTGTLTLKGDNGETFTFPVEYYENDTFSDTPVISYEIME